MTQTERRARVRPFRAGSGAGAQRWGGQSPWEAEGAARGLTHLAFVRSLVDHPAPAACVAGREVLHPSAGVTDRVKVV